MLGSDCFGAPTELAGSSVGYEFSDETYLQEELRGDMRVWGFNICLHSNGVVSGFGLVVAPNYGLGLTETDEVQEVGERSTEVQSDVVRLTVGGQEISSENCRTLQLQDPEADRIKSMTVYWDEVVVGLTIKVADREGSFGRTDEAENSLEYNFDETAPLIGIYGYSSPQFIYGMGFYTIDAVSESCKYVEPALVPEIWPDHEEEVIEEPEPEVEPEPVVEEVIEEPEPEPEPEVPDTRIAEVEEAPDDTVYVTDDIVEEE